MKKIQLVLAVILALLAVNTTIFAQKSDAPIVGGIQLSIPELPCADNPGACKKLVNRALYEATRKKVTSPKGKTIEVFLTLPEDDWYTTCNVNGQKRLLICIPFPQEATIKGVTWSPEFRPAKFLSETAPLGTPFYFGAEVENLYADGNSVITLGKEKLYVHNNYILDGKRRVLEFYPRSNNGINTAFAVTVEKWREHKNIINTGGTVITGESPAYDEVVAVVQTQIHGDLGRTENVSGNSLLPENNKRGKKKSWTEKLKFWKLFKKKD
ncbi:MAG TPA: hypothetical protein VEA59_01105 [Patescibacteria group bacterium]|nr:hypothetical protein [Patescibacteria group bacterium]